jgi:hypothetical protein
MRRLSARMATALAGATLTLPFLASAASAGSATPGGTAPIKVPDSAIHPSTTTVGGASVLPTTKTVAHWHGTTLNPDNGVTYGFNMVGSDPSLRQSTTITADIIPVNVVVGGQAFSATQQDASGQSVLSATLDSPQFTPGDYASADFVTSSSGGFTSGGTLSPGNNGVQLEDATMRSQFNAQGTGYHLILKPVVHPAVTLVVPGNQGTTIQTARGVVAGDVSISWWTTQIQKLNSSLGYIDPTHLPIYLTNNVMNYIGTNPLNCCVIGFHGAALVPGSGSGGTNGQGSQPVLTYAWASYVTPGFFNPRSVWALQDIQALSHEVSEWADDPFVNSVEPWLTPTAPQYGCTSLMETGDPVVGIGFTMGRNTFEQGPTPDGTQVADGYYHPEDEVFMPWFMRLSPNTVSQPVQGGTDGRYTFMGSLNPYSGFKVPATGC